MIMYPTGRQWSAVHTHLPAVVVVVDDDEYERLRTMSRSLYDDDAKGS
jgi:hypothetical protein